MKTFLQWVNIVMIMIWIIWFIEHTAWAGEPQPELNQPPIVRVDIFYSNGTTTSIVMPVASEYQLPPIPGNFSKTK
jgi:hypothetical protein